MLAAGSRVGPYEIAEPIGAGGMGEVFRARDTRLGRDVAVKVLPAQFAGDAERLARFAREAQALASLNHPNIATIHGFEESDGLRALILELVPGDTLAERIGRRPVPIAEAIAIARQIADAVAAAHEQGIVHRDLKPANIKVRDDGTVKVLDFGLAKLAESSAAAVDATLSPTITSPALTTGAGMLLGTAAYMSPEQARGQPADKRSDVWSFGAVLYEMLTGRRAFAGDDVADTLAAVLRADLDWSSLPPATPEPLRRLLRRALQRNPARRLADMADARLDIDEAQEHLDRPLASGTAAPARVALRYVVAAAALIVSLAAAGFTAWSMSRGGDPPPAVFFEVPLPPTERVGLPRPELSPDGRTLAFVWPSEGTLRIWLKPLEAREHRPLRGTDGVRGRLWWSADSRWLAFVRDGRVWKVSPDGGPPEPVVTLDDPAIAYSGSWGSSGVMLLAPVQTGGGLLRVDPGRGRRVAATALDAQRNERQHATPHFLPDGRHYLFVALAQDAQESAAYVGVLDSDERRPLPGIVSEVRYSASGHLLFVRDGTMMAQRFDLSRLELEGNAFPVVDSFVPPDSVNADLSLSDNGTLAYHANAAVPSRLIWFDRDGREVGLAAAADVYVNPELSPDDRFVLFDTGGSNPIGDVKLLDLARGTSQRITDSPANDGVARWGPRGRIVFRSDRNGTADLYTREIGVTASDQPLLRGGATETPFDWSRDGKYIAYSARGDLWAISPDDPSRQIRITTAQSDETNAQFSPDGSRWVAFQSAESGTSEIYLQSFPDPRVKVQVSTKGGTIPRWSHDGRWLFYVDLERRLMEVGVSPSGEPGVPRPVFSLPEGYPGGRSYAVASDGRFLVRVSFREQQVTPITVILNWASLYPGR